MNPTGEWKTICICSSEEKEECSSNRGKFDLNMTKRKLQQGGRMKFKICTNASLKNHALKLGN